MKLSKSVGYALVAIGHIAQSPSSDLIKAKTIAKEHKIPLGYIAIILQQLVQAKILKGVRGQHGGYILQRPPTKITFLNIVEAIEGPLVSTPNIWDTMLSSSFNQRLSNAYLKAFHEAARILAKTTIAASLGKTSQKKAKK